MKMKINITDTAKVQATLNGTRGKLEVRNVKETA